MFSSLSSPLLSPISLSSPPHPPPALRDHSLLSLSPLHARFGLSFASSCGVFFWFSVFSRSCSRCPLLQQSRPEETTVVSHSPYRESSSQQQHLPIFHLSFVYLSLSTYSGSPTRFQPLLQQLCGFEAERTVPANVVFLAAATRAWGLIATIYPVSLTPSCDKAASLLSTSIVYVYDCQTFEIGHLDRLLT